MGHRRRVRQMLVNSFLARLSKKLGKLVTVVTNQHNRHR